MLMFATFDLEKPLVCLILPYRYINLNRRYFLIVSIPATGMKSADRHFGSVHQDFLYSYVISFRCCADCP